MNLSIKPDLSGKIAVITGGAGVLCREFAKALALCGAKVAILNRTLSKAEAVAAEIAAMGGTAIAVGVDVTKKDSVEAAHEAVLAQLGPCDILINGAGGNNPRATTDKEYFELGDIDADTKSFFDLGDQDMEFVFNLNFIGTLLPTQAFAKDMVGREGCTIINVSSMNAYTPLTKIPAYSGAKAAISNFTQWLAVHFSRVGIRVNAIAPGYFPSYALGSAYGAQLLRKMSETVDVAECMRTGNFEPINQWNRENIWKYGSLHKPMELLESVLGEPFDPTVYTDYLEKKFSALYGF